MRSPVTDEYPLQCVPQIDSTQRGAADALASAEHVGAILAAHQTAGRGRFGRFWYSKAGDSLALTLILRDYANHPRPYLLGMNIALAVAGVVHAQVRWPNDIIAGEKKVGGILTELLKDPKGDVVAVVGIGLNLNQETFPPELEQIATSLYLVHGVRQTSERVAESILSRIKLLPEPDHWHDIEPIWALFDHTPGKRYKLPNGAEAIAVGVGSEGQLICSVEGESHSVLAAEALFGPNAA